ncbi:flagellar filament capping protein FliD [Salinicola aestuarinus]|uniref:flagellar filament capping protein FliD n=1 Tax=Salinicola aestuarinus TaxID=1949082 RepID=UPI000DA188CA|nr:flagellar filament capping protein FliD [Salinicola aestuarinus]
MASISSLGVGSGLDLNGLLDQLRSAENQKLTPIVDQQKSYNTKLSAFGKLENSLESLRDSLDKLNDAETFSAVKSSISGDAVSVTTTSDAVAGRYDIEVSQLAKAHSMASAPGQFEGPESAFGSAGQLTLGDGDTAVTLDYSTDDTLASFTKKINDADTGVSASMVNDGSGYRLVLTAKETGTESAINVSDTGSAFGFATTVEAQDAKLNVNGVDIVSQSNTVEEALQGATLELTGTTEAATLSVSKDTESMEEAVQSFVKAYNSFQTTADSLTSYNTETDAAGALLGNSTMRSVESRLREALSFGAGGDAISRLSDLGIERERNGQLKVDDDKLSAAITSDSAAVSRFFGGEDEDGGFAGSFNGKLDSILDEGGLLESATNGIDSSLERVKDRYSRTQDTINSTIDRYRKQFSQLDSMVAQMNSTSSYLTQQFNSLNAQLNQ